MEILHILAGPVIGAVIGYCTNWVAVKMLFKPLHPIKFFGKTLPFTPGVIPKNMTRIGRACGQAVSESLLTSEDMTAAFAKEETKNKVADKLYEKLFSAEISENSGTVENAEVLQSSANIGSSEVSQDSCVMSNPAGSRNSGLCINSVGNELLGESGMESAKQQAADFLTDKVSSALQNADYEKAIADIGGRFIREKLNNPMIKMFLNESVIASFAGPLADSIRGYIAADGEQMIRDMITPEIENLCDTPLGNMLKSDRISTNAKYTSDTSCNIADNRNAISGTPASICECAESASGELIFDETSAKQLIGRIYEKCIEKAAPLILAELDISNIVEEKIAAMDVGSFEDLVLSVMKTELDYVVRLGALIGFVIGIINVFL